MRHIKILKFLSVLLLALFVSSSIYSVQVVKSDDNTQNAIGSTDKIEGTGKFLAYVVVWLMGFFLMFIVFCGILVGLFWLVWKVYKKLTEYNRGKHDFIYNTFTFDLIQCHYNYDKNLKKRNWKLFWLFWKRKPVFVETENGLEAIGGYHGETYRKNGFYMIGLYNKVTLFKYIGQIIIIPLDLKSKIVKKYNVNGEDAIIIKAEGIDRFIRDMYYLPLVKNPKKDKEFLDFSDKISESYLGVETYRDIITENLQKYREGIIKSVESNPQVHFKRRMPKE
jgi:hypothetical protein